MNIWGPSEMFKLKNIYVVVGAPEYFFSIKNHVVLIWIANYQTSKLFIKGIVKANHPSHYIFWRQFFDKRNVKNHEKIKWSGFDPQIISRNDAPSHPGSNFQCLRRTYFLYAYRVTPEPQNWQKLEISKFYDSLLAHFCPSKCWVWETCKVVELRSNLISFCHPILMPRPSKKPQGLPNLYISHPVKPQPPVKSSIMTSIFMRSLHK